MKSKTIIFLATLLIFSGLAQATVTNNTIITVDDADLIMEYGDVVKWNVNVSSNLNEILITEVLLQGNPALNMTRVRNDTAVNWSLWEINASLNTVLGAAFGNDCTYPTVYMQAKDNVYVNITRANEITPLPCIEAEGLTTTPTLTVTDKNTSTVVLGDSEAGTVDLWLVLSNVQVGDDNLCNYGCTGEFSSCLIEDMRINTTTENVYCIINITRIATDTGNLDIDFSEKVDIAPPSNLPAALVAGASIVVVIGVIVSRRKSRGGGDTNE